jgi:hypothetical protein
MELSTIAIQRVILRTSEYAPPAIQIRKHPRLLICLQMKIQISGLIGAVDGPLNFVQVVSQNTRGFHNASSEALLCSLIQRLAGSVGDIMHTKVCKSDLGVDKGECLKYWTTKSCHE